MITVRVSTLTDLRPLRRRGRGISRLVREGNKLSKRAELSIDIAAIQDIAQRGVRRAIAFLGLGLRATCDGPPKSVTLESRFSIHWFPDPLPPDVAEEISREYEAWITGSALKELDQYFALFLDEVWDWIRLSEFHGCQLPTGFGPDRKFRSKTNVGKKLNVVEAALGVKGISSGFFDAYSFARNALTHNAGIVRQQDTNRRGALSIRWHAPTVVIKADGDEYAIDQRGCMPQRVFSSEAQLVFRMTEREQVVALGERIALSRFDLSEICFSYQNAAETISKGLSEYLKGKGITSADPSVNIVGRAHVQVFGRLDSAAC